MRNWYRQNRRNYRNNATRREYERARYAVDDAYRERKQARNMVGIRLRRGTMTRGSCAICGATTGVCAHHNDYTKPLDIVWLCTEHHNLIHGPIEVTP